jgi:hypothetical protein
VSDEADRWADLEGPPPPRIRALLDALREVASLPAEEAEALQRDFFEAMEARAEGRPGDAGVPLDFETWSDLSALFIDARPDTRRAVLEGRGISCADWKRSDAHHIRSLVGDVVAGRTTRPGLYARKCAAEVALSKRVPLGPEVDHLVPGEKVAPAAIPAVAVPAAPAPPPPPPPPPEAATFQKREAAAGLPPVVQSPSHLVETAKSPELPTAMREALGRLPFREGPPVEVVAAPDLTRTMKLPGAGSSGKTMPLPAMVGPGGAPPAWGAMTAPPPPTLPFRGQAKGKEEVQFPALTVEEYASLRAELTVTGKPPEEILTRYNVRSEASRQALDAHWRKLLAADAGIRARFEPLLKEYKQWLMRQMRRPR